MVVPTGGAWLGHNLRAESWQIFNQVRKLGSTTNFGIRMTFRLIFRFGLFIIGALPECPQAIRQ
jgi:hypothetical protein